MKRLMKDIFSIQNIHARTNGEGQWSEHMKQILLI